MTRYKSCIRPLTAIYLLVVSLIWLTLGVYSLLEGEVILSGSIEDGTDVLLVLAVWIMPFILIIYRVLAQRPWRPPVDSEA